jgi:hypothetical protein
MRATTAVTFADPKCRIDKPQSEKPTFPYLAMGKSRLGRCPIRPISWRCVDRLSLSAIIGIYDPARSARSDLALQRERESAIVGRSGDNGMAKKNKLRDAAVKIGSAVGEVDGRAHKAALQATIVARREFKDLTKQVKALKKQLEKSTNRLKSALK